MPSPNINASLSWAVLYILLISAIPNFVLRSEADPQITEAGHGCSLINTTNPSALIENRKNAFSLLAENISSTGFATASSGNGTNKVYGLAQCRNDLSMEDCTHCYTAATEQIVKYCPSEIGARMIFDGCFLRYENYTFFDQAQDAGNSNVCISDASSRPKLFSETTQRLLAKVRSKALKNEGFATDEISANGLSTAIYGLAMCRRTLTTNSCDVCLQHATLLAERCFSLQDGRGLDAGCYLRYSTLPFYIISSSSSSPSKTVIILVGTLGAAALIAVLWVLFMFRHSLRKLYTKVPGRSQHEQAEVYFAAEEDNKWGHLFTYDSLRAATKNFDSIMKIGEGGFGQVYKGIFSDGREIAVKKLFVKQSARAFDEFVTEVKLISAARHRNLVRLLGCCTRGLEKLLVYELVPNMSLDKHLFANTAKPLSWKTRFEIILGTAHGLAYLNEECWLRILHRDIKAANILLDNEFQAKIADFGLAKLFPDDMTHLTTRVGGTVGYTAPEYAVHGQLTDKADVYSYGMLVLEIVSGRKYIDSKLPPPMELLLGWAWNLYEKNEVFRMVDRRLIEEPVLNKQEILKVIQIAFLCTQGEPELRPLMSKVVSMLTSSTEILTQPTRPAFIDDNSTSNGLDSADVGWMVASTVASSRATVSISLEAR
ncbi:cysteine-rich receptor-like protein kinase 2 [Cryptomeria japonica]|uniref:cysteine-rich receptor-like protein kinase 2 n=1 Tax=Cryptomeria japonica TaxID=3369 RepID=UPI0027DA4EB1|nr:cysteine-rich receptor-like protein kinase 2 [Cryptomeria japonica]